MTRLAVWYHRRGPITRLWLDTAVLIAAMWAIVGIFEVLG